MQYPKPFLGANERGMPESSCSAAEDYEFRNSLRKKPESSIRETGEISENSAVSRDKPRTGVVPNDEMTSASANFDIRRKCNRFFADPLPPKSDANNFSQRRLLRIFT